MSKIRDALRQAQEERRGTPVAANSQANDNTSPEVKGTPQTRTRDYDAEAAKRNRIISPYFEAPEAAERFKRLRTKVFAATQESDLRMIMVTSTLPGEGKSFVAVNLAITFAREVDQTVLLVETDLQKPTMMKHFGIDHKPGLTDYLLHDCPLSEAMIRPGIEKLVLLPAGPPVTNSAELLRSHKMQALVAEMKSRYANRYVFFDAPAISTSVDALVLADYIDRILFVVQSGRVAPDRVADALGHLDAERVLGTVLNKRV